MVVRPDRQAVSAITRQVLVTPLRSSTTSRPTVNTAQPSLHCEQHLSAVKVDKVLLKAVNKKGKKHPKTFTLRNVDQSAVLSCDDLKDVIRKNLRYDITSGDFDVGYIQDSSVVRIRSNEDLAELWSLLKKSTTLWCDGLSASAKRKHSDDECDDDHQSRKSRNKKRDVDVERVQDLVEQIKAKHGASEFTKMQLRIWAEFIVGGMCSGTDDLPSSNTMFLRAGDGNYKKKSESPVTQALTNVASAITAALLTRQPQEPPTSSTQRPSTGVSSPAKLIENRSKLYKQLTELKNLKGCGVLSDAEYAAEKATIMDLLKQLNPRV